MELVVEAAPPEQVLLFGLLALKWQKSHASALAARARGVYLSNAIMEVGSREGCLLVHRLIERGHSALLLLVVSTKMHFWLQLPLLLVQWLLLPGSVS